jgi:hypothetical protein
MGDALRGIWNMEPDAEKRASFAALNVEIDAIYFADRLYWEQREGVTHDARIEHQRRQKRLEEIRKELDHLRSAQVEQNCGQGARQRMQAPVLT